MLMTKAYLALQEGDVANADLRSSQAMHAALASWWQLPEVGCSPQLLLLQNFQQVGRAGNTSLQSCCRKQYSGCVGVVTGSDAWACWQAERRM